MPLPAAVPMIIQGVGALASLFGNRRSRARPLRPLSEYMAEGQDSVNRSTAAAASSAMPQFQDGLQDIRENAIRRGVSLGDTGNIQTRNEGSLASAFQRNLANTAGSSAMELYQTSLDRRAGDRDYRASQDNASNESRGSIFGALGSLAGSFAGSPTGQRFLGGIGSRLGSLFGQRRPSAMGSNMARYGSPA